jgi:ribosomal-protein-alanine N-acetyltransferase
MIVFETQRLKVRQYTVADMENFYLLNSDHEVMQYIRPVKNRMETDVFLRQILQQTKEKPLVGRWAIDEKEASVAIGSFAIIPVDNTDRMQLGYALLKSSWGKGYATELVEAGLKYIFTKTTLQEIYALTEIPNTVSQRVLIKSGFRCLDNYTSEQKELAQFIFTLANYKEKIDC